MPPAPLAPEALLESVRRLGQEFDRRGMDEHVRTLRLYYLALTRGLVDRGKAVRAHWSPRQVDEWLEALRLPPFERRLPLLRAGHPCPACGPSQGIQSGIRTELTFPGGARVRCAECGARWLVDEDAAGT